MAQVERQKLEADIVCVGMGPATGGFLTTLTKEISEHQGESYLDSKVMPGMPLQVLCYERADDMGFGVSGVVSRARGIKQSFPDIDWSQIQMAAPVKGEKLAYLLDPIGASCRSGLFKFSDTLIRSLKAVLPYKDEALEMPFIPPFMEKHGGAVFSIGQFNQWVGMNLMSSGQVQIWPGMPVEKPLVENKKVKGVRLVNQGVEKSGAETEMFMPGMDIEAALTVVGDGPVGAVGQYLDEEFGMPQGHHKHEWAVGMKFVVQLRDDVDLEPGTVFHTFGYPEPEVFGFMYIYPGKVASLGIFIPSWFDNPVRTAYRYLQHWMMHPYIWKHVKGGTLKSWGAKSLQESGITGEPHLCGDGYARIGEGSGSTNVLTGSGVDEAWTTGTQLAEGVIELLKAGKPFTKENLEATYVAKRRASWVQEEGKVAEKSRNGFSYGVIPGLIGMSLAGFSKGLLNIPAKLVAPHKRYKSLEQYFAGKLSVQKIAEIREICKKANKTIHDEIMNACGWPEIPYDGTLLVTQQDALLIGGKVQAQGGFADHVEFIDTDICKGCGMQVCVEICSAQAIAPGEEGVPVFDREKCVHCGACLWNCSQELPQGHGVTNVKFGAGCGGLHSVEN
ncbi:MAG: 4Fe-4S ferredoxin [Deltaproteobacteria bacterium]|nr:4Fe-4S ferredoxin [Deltaproteobacteria bacterium]